jgi:hypothetical protein
VRIDPRPISASEQAVLDHVLGGGSPEALRLRQQVPSLVAVARCDCGCPTIEFDTPGAASDAVSFPLDVEGQVLGRDDEPPVDILVFVRDGRLSSLELVSYGDGTPSEWPPVDLIALRRVAR